jgi:hypothetical protein
MRNVREERAVGRFFVAMTVTRGERAGALRAGAARRRSRARPLSS